MYSDQKFLAIIQARGGSKGIPDKNIVELNGFPLIKYSIDAVKGSKYIDHFCVSSDSDKILEISKSFGADAVKRPDDIATDTAPDYKTLQHTVLYYETKKMRFDYILKIQPTSPLRTSEDLDNSIEKLLQEKNEMLISITEAPFPPGLLITTENNLLNFVDNQFFKNVNRQSLPQYYMPNGAVYIYKTNIVKSATGYPFIPGKSSFYIMPTYRSIDIDTLEDLKIASSILNWI